MNNEHEIMKEDLALRKIEDTLSGFDKHLKINILSLVMIKIIKNENWTTKQNILLNLAAVLNIQDKFSIIRRIK